MLSLFKRNDIAPVIALVVIALLIRIPLLIHPPYIESLQGFHKGFLFSWPFLKSFYTSAPTVYMLLSLVLHLCFAFYINAAVDSEKLFPRKSFIPALAYILYTALIPSLSIFSMVFVSSVLIFRAFALTLRLHSVSKPRNTCFNIGLLLGLSVVFYFPSILLLLPFFLFLIWMRPFVLQEFIAYLIGFLTTAYLSLGFLYVLSDWQKSMAGLYWGIYLPIRISSPIEFIMMTLLSVILLIYSLYQMNQSGSAMQVLTRRKWNAVVVLFFFSAILGIFFPVFPGFPWLMSMPAFCILLSQAMQTKREKMNTFTFYFLIAAVLALSWLL
ncbi:MAG: hypothetical protein JNJ58_08830 [Chitinophagaceae bacterium]|nr:hypothetical protein [Chitinophagaceae bacterium]